MLLLILVVRVTKAGDWKAEQVVVATKKDAAQKRIVVRLGTDMIRIIMWMEPRNLVIFLTNLPARALEVGSYLKSKLIELQQQIDLIGHVRGSGLFLGIELVRDRHTLEPASAETSFVCSVLKSKYQILSSIDGLHENVLVVKPPMVFSREDADYFVESLQSAVQKDLSEAKDLTSLAKTPT